MFSLINNLRSVYKCFLLWEPMGLGLNHMDKVEELKSTEKSSTFSLLMEFIDKKKSQHFL